MTATSSFVFYTVSAQNLIFSKPGRKGVLQVIDFGESELIEDGKMYNDMVGTVHYLEPECTR